MRILTKTHSVLGRMHKMVSCAKAKRLLTTFVCVDVYVSSRTCVYSIGKM